MLLVLLPASAGETTDRSCWYSCVCGLGGRHGSTVLMLAVEGAAGVGVVRYLLGCPTLREQVMPDDHHLRVSYQHFSP